MAIAFDAATANQAATGTSLTFSRTVTGANAILFVEALIASASDLVTGVTDNGIAMTRVGAIANAGAAETTYLYVLAGPAQGAANIVISTSSSVAMSGRSVSYTGAKQTSTVDNSVTNSATTASSITGTLTPVADSCWTVAAFRNNLTNTVSAGAGTTLRGTANATNMGDSNGPITPAASTSLSMTWTGSATAEVVMASFAPATSDGNMFAMWDF